MITKEEKQLVYIIATEQTGKTKLKKIDIETKQNQSNLKMKRCCETKTHNKRINDQHNLYEQNKLKQKTREERKEEERRENKDEEEEEGHQE